jgi:hypothetical protein
LSEKELTYKAAYDISVSMETAAKNVMDLQTGHNEKVNKVFLGKRMEINQKTIS